MNVGLILFMGAIWGASLFPVGGGLLFLPTLFSAPENKSKPLFWIFIITFGTYPVVALITVLAILVLLATGDVKSASWVAFAPCPNVVLFGLVWLYIMRFRDGKF